MPVHLAGILDIPSVSLYGPTTPENHGPHWKHDKSVFIESHRNGKNPSFSFNENPKTVDFIEPEDVVKSIYNILDIENNEKISSLYFGVKFCNKVVESVLDAIVPPDFLGNAPLNIRYDYLANEQALFRQLSIRKSLIVTDKEIDLNLLNQVKENILGVAYNVTENNNPQFISSVQKIGIPITLFSKLSQEKVNEYKLDYADIGLIQLEKINTKEDIEKFVQISSNSLFKTKKIILGGGKIYPSNAHRLLDIPVEPNKPIGGNVLDTPKFYEELDYFYIYNLDK